jgi:hypothetical protein
MWLQKDRNVAGKGTKNRRTREEYEGGREGNEEEKSERRT